MGRQQPELLPTDDEFRTLLNMALDRPHPTLRALEKAGTTFYCRRDPGCNRGTGQLDPYGYHALSCNYGGAQIHRSNAVGRVLARVLHQRLQAVVRREEPLCTAQGGDGFKSDFFLPHGLKPGHDSREEPPLHGDVVVAGVGAQMSASQVPMPLEHGQLTSYVADVREEQKKRKYHEYARERDMALPQLRPTRRGTQPLTEAVLERPRVGDPLAPCFIPVGFSVYGAWGSGARHLLDCLAAEVKVFGPGETGQDEWGAQKSAEHQTEADLRRRIACAPFPRRADSPPPAPEILPPHGSKHFLSPAEGGTLPSI